VAQQLDRVGGQLEVVAINPLLSPARPAPSQHDMVTAHLDRIHPDVEADLLTVPSPTNSGLEGLQ
jgi:hypothetical protein